MPQLEPTYPGIYVEELPSQTHTVEEASTASTAFVDFFSRGSVEKAVKISSWREFEQTFGGLDHRSEASYGLYQYYNNGGQTAWVVRVGDGSAQAAQAVIKVAEPKLDTIKDEADKLAGEAQTAATAAATAATAAAGQTGEDLTNSTLQVAKDTSTAASKTAEAGLAAGSAGQLLAGAIEQYDATHGPLAAETLVAASEAAQAAGAAATAAAIAQDAADAAAAIGDALTNNQPPSASDYSAKAGAAKTSVDAVPALTATAVTDVAKAVTSVQAADDSKTDGGASSDVRAFLDQAALTANQLTQATADANLAAQAAAAAADAAVPPQQPGPTPFRAAAASATSLTESLGAVKSLQAAVSTAEQVANQVAAANLLAGSDPGASADLKKAIATATTDVQAAVSALQAAQTSMQAGLKDVMAATGDASPNNIVLAAQSAAEASSKAAHVAAVKAASAKQMAQADAAAAAGASLHVLAANPGVWGNGLRVVAVQRPNDRFDLLVKEVVDHEGRQAVADSEDFIGLTLADRNDPKFALKLVNHSSRLIRLSFDGPVIPGTHPVGPATPPPTFSQYRPFSGGEDGGRANATQLTQAMQEKLDHIAPDIFNILCLPAVANFSIGGAKTAYDQALEYCAEKRAFLICDVPETTETEQDMLKWMDTFGNATAYNGAVYFPRLVIPDPKANFRPKNVAPSGTLAGIFSSTDRDYGVWKSPAGIDAVLQNADLTVNLSDTATGDLNVRGVNVLRSFAVYGNVVWGARTLAGADLIDSQWKYLAVRRTADFIEDSLVQSLKWVVFENNDERLWSQIRAEVSTFMAGLFANGAFAGSSADKAYLVKCDSSTTTAADIAKGVVNIVVGFAPERPAEFVFLKLMQLTA